MASSDANTSDSVESLRQEASDAGQSVKSEIDSATQTASKAAKQEAEVRYSEGKEVAEEQLETLSSAVGDAADNLESQGHPLASYASELSSQLGKLAGAIETKSLDDVAKDVHGLARNNPSLFMLGSVAMGFAAARFIRSNDSGENARDKRGSQEAGDFRSAVGTRSIDADHRAPMPGSGAGYGSYSPTQNPAVHGTTPSTKPVETDSARGVNLNAASAQEEIV